MRVFALITVTALAVACAAGGTSSAECTQGSDCGSGVCTDDGTCAPVGAGGGSNNAGGGNVNGGSGGADAAGNSGSGGTATSGGGGATTVGGASSGGGSSSLWKPNNDGTITRAETPIAVGLSAKFEVAANVTFDTTGTPASDGTQTWDFTKMETGDAPVEISTDPVAGQWYAADFPGATYAQILQNGQDSRGVYEVSDTQLVLRGVVSSASGTTKTELTYATPIVILQFPLQKGATWTTTSVVSGTISGVPTVDYSETYAATVDAAGTATTPYQAFPVLRVNLELTRTTVAGLYTQRTMLWSAECFGTVAKAVSQTYETGTEFTSVLDYGRLSP